VVVLMAGFWLDMVGVLVVCLIVFRLVSNAESEHHGGPTKQKD
jgi:hypothetical protein